jgi:DNA-binding beta-propeller fold protein YncE
MWKVLLLAALVVGAVPRPSKPLPRAPRVSALILHRRAQSLGAYDPDTGRKLGDPTEVGPKPHEMVASTDGKLLYITNYGVDRFSEVAAGANSLSVVSLSTFKKVGSIDLGRYHRPHGIERGHSGRLYVTTDFPPSVLVIDPLARDGHKVAGAIELDQSLPHMLALSADETKVFVSNAGSGSVSLLRLGAEGQRLGGSNIKVGGVPMGVALSPDERTLYVATRDGNEVVLIDTPVGRVRARIALPGQPARVRLTPAGSFLVVSLIGAGDVAIVDTSSLRVVHRFPVGAHAEGLTLDAIGGFGYVSVQGENKVVKFSLLDWKPVLEIKTAAAPDPILIVR